MTRALILIAAFLSLAVPAALAAPPVGKGKPEKPASASTQAAEQKAAKKCKAERALGADAFKAKYGSNGLGKCVAATSKAKHDADEQEDESAEEAKAEDNAAKKCKAERALGADAFKAKYGTNANKANAFGKCVSKLAKAQSS